MSRRDRHPDYLLHLLALAALPLIVALLMLASVT